MYQSFQRTQHYARNWLRMLIGFALATTCLIVNAQPVNTQLHSRNNGAPYCITECTPRVGVMAAFGQEADLLIQQMHNPRQHYINGNRFTTGTLENVPTVLVLSGIGLPNSIMITQLMLNHFHVTTLLFTGIAGAVDPTHDIGDVIVPGNWAFHQEVYHAENTAPPQPCITPGDLACLGLKAAPSFAPHRDGKFQRLTNVVTANNHHEVALRDPFSGQPVAFGEMRFDYPVDHHMHQVAQLAAADIANDLEAVCTPSAGCRTPQIRFSDRCVTGSSFVANANYREYLHEVITATCVDMETAGAAHVARANNVPFIAFRSLSDLAGGDSNPEAVGAFFSSGVAQRNAARMTLGFLRHWHLQHTEPMAAMNK